MWLLSKALLSQCANSPSSPARAAASSAASSLDGNACALSSETPTPQACSWLGKTTARLTLSRSGMTCALLTGALGEAVLTSFRAASRARISASRGRARASTESGLGSGRTWRGSLARYDRDSSSWRTHQLSLLADSDAFSETWPRWGTMRNGECSARTMPAHLTSGNASGSSLPTLTATEYGMIPTLNARDWKGPPGKGCQERGGRASSLPAHVAKHRYPTLKAEDKWKQATPGELARNSPSLAAVANPGGGTLNPDWCEWFMNWPVNWTSLQPMECHEAEYWKEASSATDQDDGLVRQMWFDREAGAPSLGQGHGEQHAQQSGRVVYRLPPHGAQNTSERIVHGLRLFVRPEEGQEGEALREFDLQQDARTPISRTSMGRQVNRVDRIKALGNGQVPAVVALAWRELTGRAGWK